MSLATDIIRVINLTEALAQALQEGDLDRCSELLPQREKALVRLGLTCRDASRTEVAACRDSLQELEAKDAELRRNGQDSLNALGQELARAGDVKRGQVARQPLCIDRKA